MNLELLETFYVLSKTKSFSKTAETLNIVQSTVSLRISELEKILGKQLISRNTRTTKLTFAGEFFLPYASRILNDLEDAKEKIKIFSYFDDKLTIGASYTILQTYLLPLFEHYLIQHPRISLKAFTGHSYAILQSLIEGEVDIAFVYQASRISRSEVILCREEEFAFVVHPDNPLAKYKEIEIEALNKTKIFYQNWGDSFNHWLKVNLPVHICFHADIDSPQFILSLIKRGIGGAFMARSTVEEAIQQKLVVEVPIVTKIPLPKLKTYAVINSLQIEKPAIKCCLEIIKNS